MRQGPPVHLHRYCNGELALFSDLRPSRYVLQGGHGFRPARCAPARLARAFSARTAPVPGLLWPQPQSCIFAMRLVVVGAPSTDGLEANQGPMIVLKCP